MNDILDFIFSKAYCLFESIYGEDLSWFLWGIDCDSNFTMPTLYHSIGGFTLSLSFVVAVLYYFVINRVDFSGWLRWLQILGVNSVLALWLRFDMTVSKLNTGAIPQCYTVDGMDCFLFGCVDAIWAAVYFFLISWLIKRWSTHCKHTPFSSNWPKRYK